MNTLQKNKHHNRRLLEFCLERAYPEGITVERLIDDNLINAPQVAELAICKTNGVKLCSIGYGRDFEDDSDVKTITVYEAFKKTWLRQNGELTGKYNLSISHKANIKDISTKIGKLRVICYNPLFELWKYFVIPFDDYRGIKKISISFCKNTGNTLGKYAKYEVETWNEMCFK